MYCQSIKCYDSSHCIIQKKYYFPIKYYYSKKCYYSNKYYENKKSIILNIKSEKYFCCFWRTILFFCCFWRTILYREEVLYWKEVS